MRLDEMLNQERIQALGVEQNAYINHTPQSTKPNQSPNPTTQSVSKVIFPEPYENLNTHYSKNDFCPPQKEEPKLNPPPCKHQNNSPMFDIKSLLPLLTQGGNMMDMLKPLILMFGGGKGGAGGGLGDIAKVFDLFKPKSKPKKEEKKEEDISSKFDDMIIIED